MRSQVPESILKAIELLEKSITYSDICGLLRISLQSWKTPCFMFE